MDFLHLKQLKFAFKKLTRSHSEEVTAGKQPQPGLPQPPGCQAAAPSSGCTSHSQLVFRLCPCQAGPKRHAACPRPGLGALCSLSCKCSSHSCSSSPLRSQFPREAFPDHAARSLPLISFWGSGNRRPQLGGLRQQKCSLSQFWRTEV